MSKEEKNELSVLSGEVEVKRPEKFEVPTIKLDGRGTEGIFYKIEVPQNKGEDLEKKDLGDKVKGTILKIRRTLNAYSKQAILFTNQHNSWKDEVVLFEYADGKTRMLDKGSVPTIREKYPELRVRQVLYFLTYPDNEIVKFIIKGKGLSSLFDFYKEFEKDEHLFEYVIEVGATKQEGELGDYYFTTFRKVDLVDDLELVANKIKEVAEKIESTEDFYAEKKQEIDKAIEDPTSVIVREEDEINVDEIPF